MKSLKIEKASSKEELDENIERLEKNEDTKKENILGTEKIGTLLRKFAVPSIISLVVSALYNIVDQIFIGQGVGYIGNAATNIVFPLTVIACAFALLIGDGTAAYTSLNLGKKDEKEASRGVNNSIILSAIVGIIFLIFGLIFKQVLLKIFGVTESSYEYANTYMTYIILGLPFYIFTTAINPMIRADGSPKFAMFTMTIGAILNIILDPISIFILHMGVKGAAIATAVSQVVSAIVSLCYLRRFKTVKISKDMMKLNLKTIKKVCSLGISSFITQIAITFVVITQNNVLTKYGAASEYGSDIPLSALGIVMKVYQIFNSIVVGIAVGAQPIVGFNYGAKKYQRVKKVYFLALLTAIIVAILGTIMCQFFPQVIVNLFGNESDLYNEFAYMCFRIYLMFVILAAVQIVSSIYFQAIGKPVKSVVLSLSRQILILIPSLLILPIFFGVKGILYAGPVSDFIAFIITLILVIIEMKKMNKMITNN